MKKVFWTVFIGMIVYALAVIAFRSQPEARAQALPNTQYVVATVTPSPRPTQTPIPSATIDYQSTAAVAQSTAMEAVRVNAQITAAYERRIQEQMIVTAQYEQRVQEIYSWTATAALTSVPLTSTQQAALNTQIPMRATLAAAYMTSTYIAPTQEAVMQEAINYRKYGGIDYFARWFMYGVLGVFMLALVAWFVRNPVLPKPAQSQPTEYTVINRKREPSAGNGYQMTRFVVPCTSDQLTELAKGIADGSKSWAINQWEGAGKPFTRDGILRVRAWARENKFALETANGELVTTEAGTDFLIDWLDSQQLPDNYAFEAENAPTPNAVVSEGLSSL